MAADKQVEPAHRSDQDYRGWSPRSGPDNRVRFVFGEPYQIASLKTYGNGVYAPHAFRASSGELFLGYYTYPDDIGPNPFPTALIYSNDSGITWRSLGERGNLGYLFGELQDGRVLVVDCQGSVSDNDEYSTIAQVFTGNSLRNAGFVKQELQKVFVRGFEAGFEPYFHLTRMVRTASGTVVTPVYAPTSSRTGDMWYSTKTLSTPTQIICLSSEDEGQSWRYLSGIAADSEPSARSPRGIGLSEPFIERLSDGRLICMYRDDRQTINKRDFRLMKQCWSSDSGRTWTTPTPCGYAGVDPCLVQLANGVLLCSFGRPRVRLMYSLNGGLTWAGASTIFENTTPAPSASTPSSSSHAYTSIVALSDDTILYFFDVHNHENPWTGRLPTARAVDQHRTNSIFVVPIRVLRI